MGSVSDQLHGATHVIVPRRTFHVLNGLRGVAAIAVVLFHSSVVLRIDLIPNGALAVDFFFLLSGFVVAHAYDRRLEAGLTHTEFFKLRINRFYPIYLIGVLIGCFIVAGLYLAGDPEFHLWEPALALALALLFLPMIPSGYSGSNVYPMNGPSWSLAVELVVNWVYAVFQRHLTVRRLAAISGAAAVALVVATALRGSPLGGPLWEDIELGYIRALFSFPIGVIIYRVRDRIGSAGLPFPIVAALLTVALCVHAGTWNGLYQLGFIFLISPMLVAVGLGEVSDRSRSLCQFLGRTSYPIYAIHFPLIILLNAGAPLFGIDPMIAVAAGLAVLLLVSAPLDAIDERRRKGQLSWRAPTWPLRSAP
ncbi:acyltransferase [Sphingorhabdus soli]|uniref:Acyltransferase n=1 Tax=Flavisphingopyxis soli TaxID=2601267 RepID=A0A5C6U639_9SPHN|nr:acyltransferase [Sphingorhabdus soli]TXC68327.1 acyltransferase [Sphingorhabdus soli]